MIRIEIEEMKGTLTTSNVAAGLLTDEEYIYLKKLGETLKARMQQGVNKADLGSTAVSNGKTIKQIYDEELERAPHAPESVLKAYHAIGQAIDNYIEEVGLYTFAWGFFVGKRDGQAQ